MSNNIGKTIKYYRTGLGLSQEYMASVCGISQPAYAAYESGRKTPKFDTVKEIAGALGIHPLLLYKEDFNNNRGYFYKFIMDNCLDIVKDDNGFIQIKFDESFEALYFFYQLFNDRKKDIDHDYVKDSPEYIEKMQQLDAMYDFFASTWPEFDYSYKISTGEETKSSDTAKRHALDSFTEHFATFISKTKHFFKLQ